MDLADHTNEQYQKKLYSLQCDPRNDKGARSPDNVALHCHWIHKTFSKKRYLRILDVGCGIGLYSHQLAKYGHQVVGIDISAIVIKHAAKISVNDRCSFICGDIFDYNSPDKFDLILFTYSIFNTLSYQKGLALLQHLYGMQFSGGAFYIEALCLNKETFESGTKIQKECSHDDLFPEAEWVLRDIEWNNLEQSFEFRHYYQLNTKLEKTNLKLYAYSEQQYKNLLIKAGWKTVDFVLLPPGAFDNAGLPYSAIIARS